MEIKDVLQYAKDQAVETIDLKLTNLFGGLHHITLPITRLNETLFETGIGIDGSSIPGFKLPGRSDASLVPDPATAVLDPFWDQPTLSLLGSVYKAGTTDPYPLDPRQVALRAQEYGAKSGIADESRWGPELEFYIFKSMKFSNQPNHSFYHISSEESDWGKCSELSDSISYPIAHQAGYHAAPPQDKHYLLREKMCKIAGDFGIKVKYHHHEVGSAGQEEIEVELAPLITSGDAVAILKYICKMVAMQEGYVVTFMPKPLHNEAGSGMHFHQHLFKGGKPVFWDENGYEGLSQEALYYIGGLLKHGPALLALTNPSTNSYKRLIPGFEAPVRAMFGVGNRAAAVRIPKYANQPHTKRVEFRPPDATTNAYLAMAAQLMAGLDGIKNKIDPIAAGYGPFDTDVHSLPKEKQDAIPILPTCLHEALEALEKDNEFLLKGDVFTENLISNWIEQKSIHEDNEIRRRPHPYEMFLYFNA